MTKANMFGKAAAVATVLAMFAGAVPASAAMNSSSIVISTINRGSIHNDTSAKSHTGDNDVDGSHGGNGDDGGEVESGTGSFNNGGAETGNGGDGGNANDGGLVNTGDATANAGTQNDLNNTNVDVQVPTDMNSASLAIATDNNRLFPSQNHIDNDTRARARTGDNDVEGSYGGDGDDAGDVEAGGTGSNNNGGATTGDGGNGGSSDLGGTATTGNASSTSATVNWLNTILVRVRN